MSIVQCPLLLSLNSSDLQLTGNHQMSCPSASPATKSRKRLNQRTDGQSRVWMGQSVRRAASRRTVMSAPINSSNLFRRSVPFRRSVSVAALHFYCIGDRPAAGSVCIRNNGLLNFNGRMPLPLATLSMGLRQSVHERFQLSYSMLEDRLGILLCDTHYITVYL